MQRHGQFAARRLGNQRQREGDKALHVGRAAAVKTAVLLGQAERVAVPFLPGDRHDIGMAGQDYAAAFRLARPLSDRREQIGLALAGAAQRRGDAVAAR